VFDNAPSGRKARSSEPEAPRRKPEDARIALRCNREELSLVDSFVTAGEYPTRSELMRAALHAFLRARTLSTAPTPPVDADGLIEVPARLRPEEYADIVAYAHRVNNRQDVRDTLAQLVRYGEKELQVRELAQRAREMARDAVATRTQVGALTESGKDLERRGVVGR